MSMSAQWLRPQCSRAPETGGSSMSMSVTVSVRPRWKQSALWRIKQQPPGEVRSESNSESVSAEVCRRPRGKNNSERPIMTEYRSTGGLTLPGDDPSTGPTPIRTVWWLGSLST
jgi:hypothetical protein